MQQVVQNIRNGTTSLANVPMPNIAPGHVLIANQASLISAGTEKMIVDLTKKSLLGKARERPDHVKRVLQKVRNEGLLSTIDAVKKKLSAPMLMGYSSAGVVVACGSGVEHFKQGDRVASNGPHADVVSVPQNLCASVPDSVGYDHAAFAVLGSIAIQGVRLAKVHLGETVLVVGLGLVGQLTVSLLHAAGVRVLGTDPDPAKCELATRMGATIAKPNLDDQITQSLTGGLGCDAVIITASTKSNGPIEAAAQAVRQKGRIVLVGVVGLEIDRRPFYFKECEFVVSCSYGPGRYDPDYEDRGHDYPAAYVRWTEQRNIDAVLRLMGEGKLDVAPLISHRYQITEALDAYKLIDENTEPYLGIVIEYPKISSAAEVKLEQSVRLRPSDSDRPSKTRSGPIKVGVIGAGNFARMTLIPAIKQVHSFQLKTICSARGLSGTFAGQESGFELSTTDEESIFKDSDIDAVFSITRHNDHFRHVLQAINSGKSIFVEKPLCLTTDELQQLDEAYVRAERGGSPASVMVGFNRRFAPAAKQVKQLFVDCADPISVSFRFNAGEIPSDHWTQNETEGGGRIIGEACHAIDLATYLIGSPPVRVFAESVGRPTPGVISDDQCFITMRHANGGVSNIAYLASGDRGFPKERIEVFGAGRMGVIDDFRSVTTSGSDRPKTQKLKTDKGHLAEVQAWAEHLLGRAPAPISWHDLRCTTLAAIKAVDSLRLGEPIWLDETCQDPPSAIQP